MRAGRHEQRPVVRVRARWLVALAALVALLVAVVAPGSASAAGKTVKTQLSLTGLVDSDNPVGGSQISIKPGDKVSISTSLVPTRGLDKLGLGGLVDGLLGSLVSVKAVADFSKLPGGKAKTVVEQAKNGKKAITFSFPKKGTYPFTFSLQRIGLLGNLIPINLDGNQLAKAGVKLNAGNQYVGTIVVSDKPSQGGISIQLPKVSVAPSLPVVGQLPTINLPGVSAPTIKAPVPDLNPTKSAPTKSAGSSSAASSEPDLKYTAPGLSIPQQVVPQGDGGAVTGGGGDYTNTGGGGGFNGALPDSGSLLGSSRSGAANASDAALPAYSAGDNKTVDLAADSGSPTSQVPVVLAILAIIALALVAGTYARLFLLKKQV